MTERAAPTAEDGKIMDGLHQVLADLDAVIALQKDDPDLGTDPVDGDVWKDLTDVRDALQKAILDQAKDGSADARVATLIREVRRAVPGTVKVKSEPRMYHEGSLNSYYLDLAAVASQSRGWEESKARLDRHAEEVRGEIRYGSVEGKRAQRSLREAERTGDARAERRAMSSIGSSGGAFVTPEYLVNLWVPYRSADRSFVNQCQDLPMPEYGLSFNVPAFTGTTNVGEQDPENTGGDQAAPTADYQTATLTTQFGLVPISQQLADRGGYQGASFDSIIYLQSKSQLDAQIDQYIITQALKNAGIVLEATALTIPLFYGNLSAAREKLADTAGTRLPGTHCFSTSDFAGWVTSQVDNADRPIVVPDASALAATDQLAEYMGWLGLVLPGNLKWFTDDNISAASGPPANETAVIVCSPADIFVWEGEPYSFAYPETNAQNLSVLTGIRAYVASIPKHNASVAYITGAGYPTSLM